MISIFILFSSDFTSFFYAVVFHIFVTFFCLFAFCILSHSPSTSVPIYEASSLPFKFHRPVGFLSAQVLSLLISLTFLPRGIFFYPVDEDTKFSPKC